MMLLESGISASLLAAVLPSTIVAISIAHGLMSVSAMVCGFFFLATCYATLYDASSRGLLGITKPFAVRVPEISNLARLIFKLSVL